MHFFNAFASIAIMAAGATAGVAHAERADTALGTFYAYGLNTTIAPPLFYGDGLAYLGWTRPRNARVATNVTFSEDVGDNWIATPTNSSVASMWTTPRLFIDQSANAFVSAGFTTATNTSVTTMGFTMFGTLVVWESSAGDLESKWFATQTEEQGLWILKWNVDTVIEDSAVPVALKNLPPNSK